jgi:hypothetical protein
MKKIIAIISFAIITFSGFAQKPEFSWVTIKVPGFNKCEECAEFLRQKIQYTDGLEELNIYHTTGNIRAKIRNSRLDVQSLRYYITNAGFSADDQDGSEKAAKFLPLCCRPKDGASIAKNPKPVAPTPAVVIKDTIVKKPAVEPQKPTVTEQPKSTEKPKLPTSTKKPATTKPATTKPKNTKKG